MRRSSIVLLTGMLAVAFHMPVEAGDNSLSLLPTAGSVTAKTMQIGVPVEAQRTSEKILAALSSQPEWARTFIADNDIPGEPLPYHPNLRVTEHEYRAFLEMKPALVQVGSVSLLAERQQDGSIRLVTQPATARVNGITISSDGRSVTTSLASLVDQSRVNNQDAESATGRWTGTQWRHESTSHGRHLAAKFALGTRTDYGDTIIYYDVKNIHGEETDTYYEVLLFSAPK